MVVSTAIYGSETWTVRKIYETGIQSAEMTCSVQWPDIRLQITDAIQRSEKH